MKIVISKRRRLAGAFLAEACIGLSLMTFTWLLLSYSLYMANNHIRTEMAARYAAWYRGASSGDPTTAQIDTGFFYQTGLSAIVPENAKTIGDVLTSTYSGGSSSDASTYSADEKGPFLRTVTFGVSSANNSSPFPFNVLSTQVAFMPDLTISVLSVKSSCQWDNTSDTWNTPGAAFDGIISSLKSVMSDALKKL